MTTIAAFYWKPEKNKCSISYMLLDDQLNVIEKPKHIELNTNKKTTSSLSECLKKFLRMVKQKDQSKNILVEYKTVMENSPKANPREDSVYINSELDKLIKREGYKGHRLRSMLKNKDQELRLFKKSLRKLKKLTSKDEAYVWKLWNIALHANKASWQKAIENLWKKHEGIKRMTKQNKTEFNEFIRQVKKT